MSDYVILNTSQIVNGIAVLMSFFLGYKYALKRVEESKIQNFTNVETENLSNLPTRNKYFTNFSHNYKMVLVVRNDLKMSKGKIAAQCGHAAVGAYRKAVKCIPSVIKAWENTGCAKIALRVDSEEELVSLKRSAESKHLNTCLVRDAGHTQVEPNSKTVLAIGPAAVEAIDEITGYLKLL